MGLSIVWDSTSLFITSTTENIAIASNSKKKQAPGQMKDFYVIQVVMYLHFDLFEVQIIFYIWQVIQIYSCGNPLVIVIKKNSAFVLLRILIIRTVLNNKLKTAREFTQLIIFIH